MKTYKYPVSELIVNQANCIYHLGLSPDEIADFIFVVGDQARVGQISKYLDKVEIQKNHREFFTHTGYLGKRRISIISSGIGPDNVEILMTELDALVNIDLQERIPKKTHKSLKIIRLGTSGSIRPEIPLDSFLVSRQSVGIDNLMWFYDLPQTPEQQQLTKVLQETLALPLEPYITSCDENLWQHFAQTLQQGNAITAHGFYAPQGRELRLPLKRQQYLQKIIDFRQQDFYFTNFEMESSVYYAFGQLLGHQMLSINSMVANRFTQQFSTNPQASVEKLIQFALEKLETFEFDSN